MNRGLRTLTMTAKTIHKAICDWCVLYRSGGTCDAKILSVWWHREYGFAHGINRRRL